MISKTTLQRNWKDFLPETYTKAQSKLYFTKIASSNILFESIEHMSC